ncbi:YciI family protein [Hoyosella altamirensis]|uniref:YCII-related domain-containing protein n=1 Tax=Hoyosella altamirensis TaxID=616997 RepID=A0A839RPI0_9ACTN|nr:YciI family protein [Hoyosella altamirensis]MBB3038297.1 hypothetical protein [Hoyosella altamirensis]
MRYLITVNHEGELPTDVPNELFEAMGAFVSKLAEDGILIDASGLAPIEKATRVELRGGDIKIVDGPFAETKEWLGGYFILQVRSEAEAIEYARQSVELHQKHVPGMNVAHDVRQIMDEED